MNDTLLHFDYKITDDPGFIYKMFDVPPKVQGMLESLHHRALEGGKGIITKLEALIGEYPQVPHLWNYLTVAHLQNGNPEKAFEVNRELIAKFPGYLFGKLNLAFEHFNRNEFDKVEEIMGPRMELKELFPDREVFHIGELTAFFKLAIMFACETGRLEAAESRFNLMEELADGHPDIDEVRPYIMQARMKAASERWEKEDRLRISVVRNVPPLRESDGTPPSFTHPQINRLYEEGFLIDLAEIKEILSLPRESLISDLEMALEDSINRFTWFRDLCDNEGWDDKRMSFPLHAIFLLGELRSAKSLPVILEVLQQSDDLTELWFGDVLGSDMWDPLFRLSESQPDTIREFVLTPGLDPYVRSALTTSITQVAHQQPGRKKEVSRWFRDLFTTLEKASPEDNIIDSDYIALAICDAIELREPSLIPFIEALYRKGYVSEGVCGNLFSVAKDIKSPPKEFNRRKLLSIYDRYTRIKNTWHCYTESQSPQAATSSKVGRNDPCPCGSGKKYKKCCL